MRGHPAHGAARGGPTASRVSSLGADDYLDEAVQPARAGAAREGGPAAAGRAPAHAGGQLLKVGAITRGPRGAHGDRGRRAGGADAHRVQAPPPARWSGAAGCRAARTSSRRVWQAAARHPDPHGGHARASACAPSSARPATSSRRCAASAIGSASPTPGAPPVTLTRKLLLSFLAVVLTSGLVLVLGADGPALPADPRGRAPSSSARSRTWPRRWPPSAARDSTPVAHALARQTGRRLTVIDTAGAVIADSDFPDSVLTSLENHRHAPGVPAPRSGERSARRLPAQHLDGDAGSSRSRRPIAGGAVRVSAPVPQVDAVVRDAQTAVLLGALCRRRRGDPARPRLRAVGLPAAGAAARTRRRPSRRGERARGGHAGRR